jgi:glycosyltransferase involved in cell wall biosynthesis
MSVVALIPAHNEDQLVGATIDGIRAAGGVDRIVVIDDGSEDATAASARDAGAEVIRLDLNAGKGGALQAGLDAVSEQANVLVLLDADLGRSAEQVRALLDPVLDGSADMTVALLPRPAGSGGFGLVKGLARLGIAVLTGFRATAPLSGQRALSRKAWVVATPFARGYGVEVALTVRACRAGLRVVEVPTTMSHAATGRDLSGFAHRGRQFAAVLAALIRLALERHPGGG